MLKTKLAVIIAAAMMANTAMAQNFESQVFANENVKAIELSQTEMQETQGAILPLVLGGLVGANAGMWGQHAYSYKKKGRFATPKELVKPAIIGASIGTGGAALGAASGGGIAGLAAWGPVTSATNTSAQLIYNNAGKNNAVSKKR